VLGAGVKKQSTKPSKSKVKQWHTCRLFVRTVMATVSQDSPRKFRPFDLSGVYDLKAESVVDEDDPIHWSCERFWCKVSFDWCFIRRYTLEVEFEEDDY